MGKDPAFLFYPGDYVGGTMGMTFEEKGAYVDLLMLQFHRGRLPEHLIIRVVGNDLWGAIRIKFKKDDSELWFNERLEIEQNKRKKYSESRRKNRSNTDIKTHNKSDDNKTNIYIIKDNEADTIKIGASVNPKNRLSTLKYRMNKDLSLVAVFENFTLKDEKDIHKYFVDFNVNGDWFDLDEKVVIDYISLTYEKHMSQHMENENENKDKDINKNIYNDIISHLNKIAGTKYKPTAKETQSLIKARLNSGFEKEDFIKVLDNMSIWLKDPKMISYYRPVTLFGTKFESYLNKKSINQTTKYSETTRQNIETGKNWLKGGEGE